MTALRNSIYKRDYILQIRLILNSLNKPESLTTHQHYKTKAPTNPSNWLLRWQYTFLQNLHNNWHMLMRRCYVVVKWTVERCLRWSGSLTHKLTGAMLSSLRPYWGQAWAKMSKYNVRLTRLKKIINNKFLFVENPSRPRSKILLANGDDNSAVSVFKPSELFLVHIQNVYLIYS